jgi:hypothetical protein
MEEKTKKIVTGIFAAAFALLLLKLIYLYYYFQYNGWALSSLQIDFENFLSTVQMIYSMGFWLFAPDFYDTFPPLEVLKYAAFSIASMTIFAAVELKAFKIKKWVFVTAPLVSCALLMFFSYGGSLALNSVYGGLNAYQTAHPGCDNIFINAYLPTSIAFPIALPMILSLFILELETVAFFLLAAWSLAKKRVLNKFYLAGFCIFAAAQLIFVIASMFLPLAG